MRTAAWSFFFLTCPVFVNPRGGTALAAEEHFALIAVVSNVLKVKL